MYDLDIILEMQVKIELQKKKVFSINTSSFEQC